MTESPKKRTTISNGVRWWRYLMIPVIIGFLNGALTNPETRERDIFFALLLGILFFILYKMRRVRFDDENIYRIYGHKEKVHPYTSITGIIRSGRKVNNRRMWRVEYKDKDNLEKRFFILEGTFQHGSIKEFIKLVREANPGVKIEESHFWDQVNRSLGIEDESESTTTD